MMRQIEHHLAIPDKTCIHDVIQDIQDSGMAAPRAMTHMVHARTVPSDDDATDPQFCEPGPVRSVQLAPELVDVQMEPPFTTAASFCA